MFQYPDLGSEVYPRKLLTIEDSISIRDGSSVDELLNSRGRALSPEMFASAERLSRFIGSE